ncbi:uncharacterized protein LOC144750168 [Ciona intestinalis]
MLSPFADTLMCSTFPLSWMTTDLLKSREAIPPEGQIWNASRFSATAEAQAYKASQKSKYVCPPSATVRAEAIAKIRADGGEELEVNILSKHLIYFGAYAGKTFRWLLENDMGYVGYIVASIIKEGRVDSPLGDNKCVLKQYVHKYAEGREVVRRKLLGSTGTQPQGMMSEKRMRLKETVQSNLTDVDIENIEDKQLLEAVALFESLNEQSCSSSSKTSSFEKPCNEPSVRLPRGWEATLPASDHAL